MRRRSEHERLAAALGFDVVLGKKHGKVYDGSGRLVAVFTRGRDGSRRHAHQWQNFRACLMRAAARGDECS